MSTIEFILWISLVLIGIGGSAMCSGLEVGYYSVNRVLVRVRSVSHRGGNADRLQSMLDQPVPTLTALLVWNNIFNYAGTLALTTLIATLHLSDIKMIMLQVVVLTPLLLIFAESTPKEVFRANADVLMPRFSLLLYVLRRMVTVIPIVPILGWVANMASRLIGAGKLGSLGDARERTAELLKFGSGTMSEAQVTLIDRALQLEHARVSNEMIPIKRAGMLRVGWTIGRARVYMRSHPYSRFPVLGARGQIEGVVHAIDLYLHKDGLGDQQPIESLMREPTVLSPDDTIERALRELSRAGAQMGVVRQHGRDVGIVTRKDLVEPLVGELEEW